MTFIEQACQERATALWNKRPDLNGWRAQFSHKVLQYCENSSARPTASTLVVLFEGVAAVGAEAYRRKAPAISKLRRTIATEPQILNRKLSTLYSKAEDEVRLHQEVVARLLRRQVIRDR